MSLSMRNKFLIPTLGMVVLALAATTLISYFGASQAIEKTAKDQVNQSAKSLSRTIQMWFEDRNRDITIMSHEKVFKDALGEGDSSQENQAAANEQLAYVRDSHQYYEAVLVADPKGNILASTDQKTIGKLNIKDRGYFQESIQGKFSRSPVLTSKATGKPIFALAMPVKKDGKIIGSMVAVVDLSYFAAAFLDPVKIGETGYASMMNSKGIVLAHPDKSAVNKLDMSKFDFGQEMLSRKSGNTTYDFGGKTKYAAYEHIKSMDWILVVTEEIDELLNEVRNIGYINLTIALISVALVAVLVFLITRSITGPLNRSIDGLSEGAEQVAMASGQMATASQQLAEGSSEQAASLEEASSSMEEMASMTRQNAENAKHANSLMQETAKVVGEADQAMQKLTTSMQEISKASEQTAGIIKTIDEIAFQTNLLALNAAVEAARAGEAGAGFAVVAGEVRNLAMRAAEAAKNTAGLIEGTVKQVGAGSNLVEQTAEAFTRVSESTEKVSELVGEISSASQEQAQGIDQVTRAVGEMDTLTQKNAASAEETASAAETMKAQANDIRGFVVDLVALATGQRQTGRGQAARGSGSANFGTAVKAKPSQLTAAGPARKPANEAAKQIPLDDDDFADF